MNVDGDFSPGSTRKLDFGRSRPLTWPRSIPFCPDHVVVRARKPALHVASIKPLVKALQDFELIQQIAGAQRGGKRIAWKEQQQLCKRFTALVARGKERNVAASAIARELLGFMWAIAIHSESQSKPAKRLDLVTSYRTAALMTVEAHEKENPL